jgi:pantoate--beta-alanine ligase
MEGKFRPGHFDGVGTIVKRLFVVQPTNVYFEKKIFNNYRSSKNGDQNKLPVHVVIALFLEKKRLK